MTRPQDNSLPRFGAVPAASAPHSACAPLPCTTGLAVFTKITRISTVAARSGTLSPALLPASPDLSASPA